MVLERNPDKIARLPAAHQSQWKEGTIKRQIPVSNWRKTPVWARDHMRHVDAGVNQGKIKRRPDKCRISMYYSSLKRILNAFTS